jgi:hypothetical protein
MKLTKNWIVGFVDGGGHFGVGKTHENENRFYFVVSLDKQSVSVLYAMKTFFKCGTVQKAGQNMMEYKVSSQTQLINIIIPFFEQNPLKTQKQASFYWMAQTCMKTLTINKKKLPLDSDWLIGFFDAKASFVCFLVKKEFITQIIIGLNSTESSILDLIQDYLGYGIRYQRKDKTEIFQLSSQKDNYAFVTHYLLTKGSKDQLRTQKRIVARRWSKLILFFQTKEHHTPEGWEKAKKKYVNFKHS